MNVGFMAMGHGVRASVANARRIENAGLDAVWVGEAATDAFVTCAAIATATSRIVIGTAVALLTRPPAQAAAAASALDELSAGRFRLGLGVGPAARNRAWFAIDPSHPVDRMRDYVHAFRAAWNATPDRPADLPSGRYPVRGFVRRFASPSPHLPILIGALGPRSVRAAAAYADGVIFNVFLPVRYVESTLLPAVRAGLADGRRHDVQLGAVLAVSADSDVAAARQRVRHQILTYVGIDYYRPIFEGAGFGQAAAAAARALVRGDRPAALKALPAAMVDTLAIVGRPERVRQDLAKRARHLDFVVVAPPAAGLDGAEAEHAFASALVALSP